MVVRYPRLSLAVVVNLPVLLVVDDTIGYGIYGYHYDECTVHTTHTRHIIVIRIIYNYNYRSAVTTTTVCNSYTGVLVYLY